MTRTTCLFCSVPLPEQHKGRPRLYCSRNCRTKAAALEATLVKTRRDAVRHIKEAGTRVLLYDIETTPYLIEAWNTYQTDALQVVRESYILCFAYKWLDEEETHVVALPDFDLYRENPEDDAALVKVLLDLLHEADIVVGHNVDRFDLKKTKARLLKAGYQPPPPTATVDTLKIARKEFSLPSNRLDALGDYLGVGRKLEHEGKGLWFKCMSGDLEAWDRMRAYNVQDVELLEAVYLRLRPWATNHPAVGKGRRPDFDQIDDEQVEYQCPACGSFHTHRYGVRRTRAFLRRRVYCADCGSFSTGMSQKIPAG